MYNYMIWDTSSSIYLLQKKDLKETHHMSNSLYN